MGHSSGEGNTNKWIFWHGNDTIHLVVGPSPGWIYTGPYDFELSRWYHVAIRRSGSDLTANVDGSAIGTASVSTTIADPNASLLLGSAEGGHPVRLFDGTMDEVRIYKRALSGTEICELAEQDSCGYSGTANAEASTYGASSLTESDSLNALGLLVIPAIAVITLRFRRRKK